MKTVVLCPVCHNYASKTNPEAKAECSKCHWRQG